MDGLWLGFASSLVAAVTSIMLYGLVAFETGEYINKYGAGPIISFASNLFIVMLHLFPNPLAAASLAGVPATALASITILLVFAVLPIKGFLSISRTVSRYTGLARRIEDGYRVAVSELEAVEREAGELEEKASSLEKRLKRILDESETVLGYRW